MQSSGYADTFYGNYAMQQQSVVPDYSIVEKDVSSYGTLNLADLQDDSSPLEPLPCPEPVKALEPVLAPLPAKPKRKRKGISVTKQVVEPAKKEATHERSKQDESSTPSDEPVMAEVKLGSQPMVNLVRLKLDESMNANSSPTNSPSSVDSCHENGKSDDENSGLPAANSNEQTEVTESSPRPSSPSADATPPPNPQASEFLKKATVIDADIPVRYVPSLDEEFADLSNSSSFTSSEARNSTISLTPASAFSNSFLNFVQSKSQPTSGSVSTSVRSAGRRKAGTAADHKLASSATAGFNVTSLTSTVDNSKATLDFVDRLLAETEKDDDSDDSTPNRDSVDSSQKVSDSRQEEDLELFLDLQEQIKQLQRAAERAKLEVKVEEKPVEEQQEQTASKKKKRKTKLSKRKSRVKRKATVTDDEDEDLVSNDSQTAVSAKRNSKVAKRKTSRRRSKVTISDDEDEDLVSNDSQTAVSSKSRTATSGEGNEEKDSDDFGECASLLDALP